MANRKQERELYWRRVLKRQAKSGLSIAEFCREESVAQPSFYGWRRTIRQRDEGSGKNSDRRRQDRGSEAKRSAFVPVRVEELTEREPISIRWPGGVRIDVPGVTSVVDVTAVLEAMCEIAPLVDGAGR